MQIEQAVFGRRDAAGVRLLARSPGFRDDWLREAERLCAEFGAAPPGSSADEALFALPLVTGYVSVVQVRSGVDLGQPEALTFRLLVLKSSDYAAGGGDPFLVSDHFPFPEIAAADLPSLPWDGGVPPRRTVALLRKVLDVPNSAVLLGGVQALLDGGRLVFERREPAGDLVRSIWTLLPTNSRCQLWPATMAFANPSLFHVAVVPRAKDPGLTNYIDEERAGDYPEGRYELALQMAVEHDDQERLDALLARRSRSQVIRLGLVLLAVLVLGPVAIRALVPPAPRTDPPARASKSAPHPTPTTNAPKPNGPVHTK